MLQLAQIQLHMLNAAAIPDALSACTNLLVRSSQEAQQQPIASQLQLHFCILRALSLLSEGRLVELQKTGQAHSKFNLPRAATLESGVDQAPRQMTSGDHTAECFWTWTLNNAALHQCEMPDSTHCAVQTEQTSHGVAGDT